MRHLTNDELLGIADAVPTYTDNAELVAELARRLTETVAALAQLVALADSEPFTEIGHAIEHSVPQARLLGTGTPYYCGG